MTATPLAIQTFYNQNRNATPTSPYSGNMNKSSSTGSPYLPNYLLGGGSNSSPGSMNYGKSLSASGFQRTKLNSRSPPHNSVGAPYISPMERKQVRTSPLSAQHSRMKDKPGAPPTESLYSPPHLNTDLMETDSPSKRLTNFSPQSPEQNFLTPRRSPDRNNINQSLFSPRKENMIQSPAQIDPFYVQGDSITSSDVLDQTAVTVFGFPPAASSYILQQFAQYGTVEKYEIHNTGNWLHIKYQTKIQAKKALSKNGKIFARSIMIGVCPCIQKEIAGMENEMNMTNLNETPKEILKPHMPSTMRPLLSGTTPIRNVSVGTDLLTNDRQTPQKKDSVVSKALDYVFGW